MSKKGLPSHQIDQPHANDIGKLARGAARWVFALLIAKQIMTILTTMIVSRYVSPEDTGTVGMVLTLVSFIVLFDTGLTWATVQPKNITIEQIDSMFWFGVVLGVLLWLVCVITGPLLASFYHNPKLIMVSVIVGLSPLFNSMTTQLSALLKRTMQQKKNNVIDTVAVLISSTVGVLMAVTHMGYWAIVIQVVVMQFCRFVLLFYFSEYRPKSPRFSPSAFVLIKSGAYLAVSNFICYFQLYLGTILIGHLFGSAALGFYLKAAGLKALPTTYAAMVVTDVMVASLAAFHENHERVGEGYRKALKLIAFVGCPAGAMLYPMASEAVMIFYGKQWDAAVPLLKVMAISALILPITTTTIWLFLAAGKAKAQLYMNIGLTLITLGLYYVAFNFAHTLDGFVMYEVILFTAILPIVNLIVSHRVVGISLVATLQVVLPILFCSILTAVFVEFFGMFMQGYSQNWLAIFFMKGVFGLVFYICASFLIVKPFPFNISYSYFPFKKKSIKW
ncbi:lipopolysaccharide biosynthesis protein [Moraxellaceae bacterium AER2_44_116]|nr:lipopolysaccharide biosynthesis protein [Moraxellaceae bacterium]TQC97700.1 lipopolysaccharide biosynthesis protein [Moraxellaceae bacterium AER2_44_116]